LSAPSQTFQRACVTGGAGFIGSHLVEQLVGLGMEVSVLDDFSTGKASRVHPAARLVEGSVLDEARAAEAMESAQVVFHLAARVAIRSSFEFVAEDARANLEGTAAALRVAGKTNSVRRFVATSSMAVYSDSPSMLPVGEDHATDPISPYGVSKLAAERLTHLYCAHSKMDSLVLRLFNTYGPGQTLSPYVGVVTILVNQLRRGETPTIYGDGLQARDFVHVQDVVQGFVRAMAAPSSGETFNIGSGEALTVNALYRYIAASMGSELLPQYSPAAAGELRCSVASIAKAQQQLGYSPKYKFEQALPAVVSEICSQP
jgi:UDP-glucose 4-epimerase